MTQTERAYKKGAQSKSYKSSTKLNAALTASNKPRFQNYFDLPDTPSYFDSPEFKDYCREVEAVLRIETILHDGGQTIGDIKRALGDRYRAEWTADALETIGAKTEHKIPERFYL